MANDDPDTEVDPQSPEGRLQQTLDRGWQALEDGDTEAARTLCEQAGVASADSPEVLLLEAACLREEGDADHAVVVLRRAIAGDPEWGTPELWLAELMAMQPDTIAEALKHAARALDLADDEDEYLNAVALKAGLEAELGEVDEAKETLGDLPPPEVVLNDPLLALEIAELWLALDEPDAARARLLTLTGAQPELADGWYTLGVASEALGDQAGMRKAWLRAWELDTASSAASDAEGSDRRDRIGEQELMTVAEEALAELPEKARRLLENVPIIIADLPARADVEAGLDPRMLGLFSGTPYPDGSNVGGQPGLTQILLFQRNLEQAAETDNELRDEIRTTLLHETGHFFGMDEADLEKVGLD